MLYLYMYVNVNAYEPVSSIQSQCLAILCILQVIRTAPLTHWSNCLDVSEGTPLIAVGVNGKW